MMKLGVPALAASLSLTGCGALFDSVSEHPLIVESVTFPATVGASESLSITVRGWAGDCGRFDRIESARSAERLTLRAVARSERPPGTMCPAVAILFTKTYSDPATPPRTSPFEIVVNGKSYGTVTVGN